MHTTVIKLDYLYQWEATNRLQMHLNRLTPLVKNNQAIVFFAKIYLGKGYWLV